MLVTENQKKKHKQTHEAVTNMICLVILSEGQERNCQPNSICEQECGWLNKLALHSVSLLDVRVLGSNNNN